MLAKIPAEPSQPVRRRAIWIAAPAAMRWACTRICSSVIAVQLETSRPGVTKVTRWPASSSFSARTPAI